MDIEGSVHIDFPKDVDTGRLAGITLVTSEDIKAHYKARGEPVPFQFVGCPYVDIGGTVYAVLPEFKR